MAALLQVAGTDIGLAQTQEPPRQIEIDTLEQSRRQADAAERGLPLVERAAVAGEDAAKAARDAVRAADDGTKVAREGLGIAERATIAAERALWVSIFSALVSAAGVAAVLAALRFNRDTLQVMKEEQDRAQKEYRQSARPHLTLERIEMKGGPFGRILYLYVRNEGKTIASEIRVATLTTYKRQDGDGSVHKIDFTNDRSNQGYIPPNSARKIFIILNDEDALNDPGWDEIYYGRVAISISYKGEDGHDYSMTYTMTFNDSKKYPPRDAGDEYVIHPNGWQLQEYS